MLRIIQSLFKTNLGVICRYLWLIFSFGFLDAWLRGATRWNAIYGIFELPPNLFTLLWAILLAMLVTLPHSKRAGRILYGLTYYAFVIFAVIQYSAWLLLGEFLYISEFMQAGEGTDYASWVLKILTPAFILQVSALIAIGIIGLGLYPYPAASKKQRLGQTAIAILCCLAMVPIPYLYGEKVIGTAWTDATNMAWEYDRFCNPNTDMKLTGLYQYLFRDVQIQVERKTKDYSAEIDMLDNYFAEKEDHIENAMTGLLAEKNLIVVMMETMDDWMITPTDTPTIWYMMQNGITFTNFYTPSYSNGYTFNTEFAFNTGIYPQANSSASYSLVRNTFPYSLAFAFSNIGYHSNSYHSSTADFYNRGQMHDAWGYSKYHCYIDFPCNNINCRDDRYLIECNALYSELIAKQPFFSFVISYSPHLPYTNTDALTQTALSLYPQYNSLASRELASIKAKARLTDDMFAGLLRRLEEDNLLENTVIVGFGDHYAYGLSDKDQLQSLSEAAGSSILERTPAFIYCAGSDFSMEVDKIMQTTDLAPTLLNLFSLDVPKEIMGKDIFDPDYPGYAIFANGSWLTDSTYIKDGIIQWNNGMSEEEIAKMNAYVQKRYQINDAILDSNYYSTLDEES